MASAARRIREQVNANLPSSDDEAAPSLASGLFAEIPILAVYIALFAGLGLAIVTTGVISRAYHEKVHDRAAYLFETGKQLAAKGHNDDAVRHYRVALAIDRENNQYRLALAIALINLKRVSEADTYLRDVLQRDPTNGIANLMAARVKAEQSQREAAISYYQRAIYGLWPDDPSGNRLRTRFELIDYLRRESRVSQEVAELMQLEAELPDDNSLRLKVASLYLGADNPERAALLYRQVLNSGRRGNLDASLGLAQAQLDQLDYSGAQDTLRRVSLFYPTNVQVKTMLALCDEVLALDPTQRRIGGTERRRRSHALLQEVMDLWTTCRENPNVSLSRHTEEYLKTADERLKMPIRRIDDAGIETNMALSEKLWDDYQSSCATPDARSPLALAMKKLER